MINCLPRPVISLSGLLYLGPFPITFYYQGQLKYYNARNVIGKGPRYNNPDKDITGLGKQFIIFNHDALEMYRSVFICEGALNALTMGDRGIATMGKAISQYQVNELLKSQCERFIILLDPDAKEYAINLALKLVAYKKVKVVFLPDGKDVNDLGRSQTLKLVYATRYQSYQELISIRNSLK
jgi:DNA primase